MAIESLNIEILDQICKVLGVPSLNRPHALLADPGDFGTVLTYIPLFKSEFKKLPPELQKFVYVVGKEKYGLVAFVPKKFEIPGGDSKIVQVTEVYDDCGTLNELSYTLDDKDKTTYRVEHSLRRDLLQNWAKKKKIPVKKIIKSRF